MIDLIKLDEIKSKGFEGIFIKTKNIIELSNILHKYFPRYEGNYRKDASNDCLYFSFTNYSQGEWKYKEAVKNFDRMSYYTFIDEEDLAGAIVHFNTQIVKLEEILKK